MSADPAVTFKSQYTYIRKLRGAVPALGLLTVGFALIGLAANGLDRSVFPDAQTTPFTALGLVVLGVSLMTHRPLQKSPNWKFALAFVLGALCFARVGEGLFLTSNTMETLLSPSSGGVFKGTFGLESAVLIGCLIFAGTLRRNRGMLGELLVLGAVGCFLFAGLQQLFGAHFFGAHTAPFSLLSELTATIAIIGVYSTRPYFRVMFRRSWIGLQARVLACVVIVVPIVSASAIFVTAQPQVDTLKAEVLTIALRILVFLMVVLFVSNRHERSDQARRRSERLLSHMYRTDLLTGVANRHGAMEYLEGAWEAYQKDGALFSVILVDLDHFKRINDTFGHQSGDEVLRDVGAVLEASVRADDMVGRWGGEEFLIVISRKPGEPVIDIAQRLCSSIAKMPRVQGAQPNTIVPMPITASVGVSEFLPQDQSINDALERADSSLYAAKSKGRNQVIEAPKVAA